MICVNTTIIWNEYIYNIGKMDRADGRVETSNHENGSVKCEIRLVTA